jgi:2-succinyl-5-enolpyruvyl-6-hydroxy-3-cyclohexene-1-carboxylate synthase
MENRLKNINSFWGYLLIDELVRNDITYFCISPGSRSTPLTIAAAENDRAEKFVCLDERAAAYHALGYARATGKPAVIISTSGTAAANYYPAVVESKNSQIPLILLTADRPPELRETGANQTTDQVKMFNNFLNWQFDMPCPEIQIPAKFVLSTVDQAVHKAIDTPAGPVHLNCMFRDPLEPSEKKFSKTYNQSIQNWYQSSDPYTSYSKIVGSVDEAALKKINNLINKAKNGLVVVGQLHRDSERQAVTEFAIKLGWPVFADITSGIRDNKKAIPFITYFDQILLSLKARKLLNPDIILHFGRPLTSKRYLQMIEDFSPSPYIHFDSGTARLDPAHLVSHRICGNLDLICHQLSAAINLHSDQNVESHFKDLNDRIDRIIKPYCDPGKDITEISLARLVAQNISNDHGLFLSSSMPIRDFDMYTGELVNTNLISSNRGVSGIDGTLASAVGFAAGLEKRVTVVLGDLAMLHDLNSLSQVSESKHPLTIVLVNNGGGGIFSFLPVSDFEHVFEPYFATSHHYKFNYPSQMFDIGYENPRTNKSFVELYTQSINNDKSILIEINTARKDNFYLHQEIQKKIIDALEK